MIGRFLRSLNVGRMTEYLSLLRALAGAIVSVGDRGRGLNETEKSARLSSEESKTTWLSGWTQTAGTKERAVSSRLDGASWIVEQERQGVE